MVGYAFETMSQSDAAAFTADDYLFFITNGATATAVTAAPQMVGFGGSATNLSFGGKTLTFSADDLSQASISNHIQFNDSSTIRIGTGDGETLTLPTVTDPGSSPSSVAFGLGGSDTLTGNNGNNYLYGGNDSTTQANLSSATAYGMGGDTITAGNGNNHIYGNALGAVQGSADGNDSITAGSGSNYINGNAGNDLITVGASMSTGANTVFGGSGNDHIVITGAGANHVNGNVGDDLIDASAATFNNSLRGGMGNDTIMAGHGQDQIMGDVGADTLVAGLGASSQAADGTVTYGHLTIMTGGADNDVFDFSGTDAGDAGVVQGTNQVHSGIVSGGSTYYQTITDFTQGSDTIHLGFTVDQTNGIVHAQAGVTVTSVAAAETYANQLLANNEAQNGVSGDVAAIDVNGNTYLFYNHTGTGSIDSIVQLTGVSSTTLTEGGSGIHTFS